MNSILSSVTLPSLPLTPFKTAFTDALNAGPLLLEAEPGAGKSTLAPLWALEAAPESSSVWLIQPRVLATKSLATRLSSLLGEAVGQTVGYQVPFDKKITAATRLLVMTPGILLQHLLHNPTLDNVAIVMLDEVHERALNQDLAWVLLQEAAILREDLRLVLMSATPDPALSARISNRLFAEGYCFPVQVDYQPAITANNRQPESLADQVVRALVAHSSWPEETVLVFLPGWKDIEDSATAIARRFPAAVLCRLHSQVDQREQWRAIDPASGPRIILSTNIAETSLTIADVTLVIDSGWLRTSVYEQRTGISRLTTRRISQASARQRSGRAGRVRAGRCIRLWVREQVLAPADLPEIRTSDYLPLALVLAHWGSSVDDLEWLEPPNRLALQGAGRQLQQWQLLDEKGQMTEQGAQVSALGTHPRVAALLLLSRSQGRIPEALLHLALALHFDWPVADGTDSWFSSAGRQASEHPHWRAITQRWLKILRLEVDSTAQPVWPAALIARVFADRIGYRQDSGRYRLNSGISVEPLTPSDSQWMAFPLIQPRYKSHVGIGLPVTLPDSLMRELGQVRQHVVYQAEQWQRHTRRMMGGVVIEETSTAVAPPELPGAITAWIGEHYSGLPLQGKALFLHLRASALVAAGLLELPDLSEDHLLASLDVWLAPFLDARTRPDSLPWYEALTFYMGYDKIQKIEELFPEQLELPSGRRVSVHFSADGTPEISAKLQEFFGCESFMLASGRVPLRIQLLSPNGSPLALTADLASFWQHAYKEVRKEMRGRYPRHPWPDDPLAHTATALTNRRLREAPNQGKP